MQSQSVLDEASIPSSPQDYLGPHLWMQRGKASLAYARVAALSRPTAAQRDGAARRMAEAHRATAGQGSGTGAQSAAGTSRASLGAFELVAFSTCFGAVMALMATSGFLFAAG